MMYLAHPATAGCSKYRNFITGDFSTIQDKLHQRVLLPLVRSREMPARTVYVDYARDVKPDSRIRHVICPSLVPRRFVYNGPRLWFFGMAFAPQ